MVFIVYQLAASVFSVVGICSGNLLVASEEKGDVGALHISSNSLKPALDWSLLPILVGLLVIPCTHQCRSPITPYPLFFPVSEKAGTCARDRRALQQLALNVHIKHLTWPKPGLIFEPITSQPHGWWHSHFSTETSQPNTYSMRIKNLLCIKTRTEIWTYYLPAL